MLTEQQLAQFRSAGVVVLRQFFAPADLARLSAGVDVVLAADRGRRYREYQGVEYDMENLPGDAASMALPRYSVLASQPAEEVELHVGLMRMRTSVGGVAEHNAALGETMLASEAVWGAMGQLLGPEFIFVGSEVMCGSWNEWRGQGWHSDRGMADGDSDLDELAFTRAKLMAYPAMATQPQHGALRVIPASHRRPLHGALTRLVQTPGFGARTAHGELLPLLEDAAGLADPELMEKQLARLDAGQLPMAFAFSSEPGDAVLFNHCLVRP